MERRTSSAAVGLWPSLRRRSWYSRIPSSNPPATCALICRYRLAVSKSCHYLVRFRSDIRISSFVKLRVTFTDRYIDRIGEGVDVCTRLGPLHDSSLIARRLSGTGFKVVGSPRYFAKF